MRWVRPKLRTRYSISKMDDFQRSHVPILRRNSNFLVLANHEIHAYHVLVHMDHVSIHVDHILIHVSFHGVTDHVSTTPYDPTEYLVDISVAYVHEDNPDSTLTTQSFAKRVTVTVTHPQLNSNVTMSQVFSYP